MREGIILHYINSETDSLKYSGKKEEAESIPKSTSLLSRILPGIIQPVITIITGSDKICMPVDKQYIGEKVYFNDPDRKPK